LKSFTNFFPKFFSETTSQSNNENLTPDQTGEKKPFEFSVDKKKIFNKKTHYRNLEIDNKLNPAKTQEDQDERELTNWARKFHYDKKYLKIQDDWQKNLMKKKEKKAITKHNFENYVSIT
jgi:hypothetical protein